MQHHRSENQVDTHAETSDSWREREALAEAMIPLIGRLYRENNVVTSIHGRSLINKATMNILKAHRFARRITTEELRLEDTAPILAILTNLDLGAAAIDIGRLRLAYDQATSDSASDGTPKGAGDGAGDGPSLEEFLQAELAGIVGQGGRDGRTRPPRPSPK
jgi:glyceraldehyde 3-phosphate dehydrogenase